MTHEERLALIHRPFFITTFTTSYPHGGVAVTDNFFDPEMDKWAERDGYVRSVPLDHRHHTIALDEIDA